MSVEITRCPRCESAAVVHLPQPIGFNQWHCNQCSHQWDFANPEARALVPNHLSGGRAEQFLEEFLAIKTVVKGEAEQIWNGCSNAHQVIDVAANEDKLRVFTEQFDRWRDQLIALQAVLIVDHLMPLLTKYQISSNEQIWLFPACHEAWSPVSAGYEDWLSVTIRGALYGPVARIPEWVLAHTRRSARPCPIGYQPAGENFKSFSLHCGHAGARISSAPQGGDSKGIPRTTREYVADRQ